MLLSCIIPSWKDKYMPKTVQSILDNSGLPENELEVIVVLDGYEPEFELVQDPRVKYIRQENTGMRGAINRGVKESTGEYIARFDEHCCVSKGWDKILTDACGDNEIMTMKRYFLDPINWKLLDKPPIEAEKLIIDKSRNKFAGVRCAKPEGAVFEITAMQGSQWLMKRSWWDKVIGELNSDGLGSLYQDSVEMVFQTWMAGGRLVMNLNAWYGHKDRSYRRTHNIDGSESQKSFDYAIRKWGDYYKNVIKPKYKI